MKRKKKQNKNTDIEEREEVLSSLSHVDAWSKEEESPVQEEVPAETFPNRSKGHSPEENASLFSPGAEQPEYSYLFGEEGDPYDAAYEKARSKKEGEDPAGWIEGGFSADEVPPAGMQGEEGELSAPKEPVLFEEQRTLSRDLSGFGPGQPVVGQAPAPVGKRLSSLMIKARAAWGSLTKGRGKKEPGLYENPDGAGEESDSLLPEEEQQARPAAAKGEYEHPQDGRALDENIFSTPEGDSLASETTETAADEQREETEKAKQLALHAEEPGEAPANDQAEPLSAKRAGNEAEAKEEAQAGNPPHGEPRLAEEGESPEVYAAEPGHDQAEPLPRAGAEAEKEARGAGAPTHAEPRLAEEAEQPDLHAKEPSKVQDEAEAQKEAGAPTRGEQQEREQKQIPEKENDPAQDDGVAFPTGQEQEKADRQEGDKREPANDGQPDEDAPALPREQAAEAPAPLLLEGAFYWQGGERRLIYHNPSEELQAVCQQKGEPLDIVRAAYGQKKATVPPVTPKPFATGKKKEKPSSEKNEERPPAETAAREEKMPWDAGPAKDPPPDFEKKEDAPMIRTEISGLLKQVFLKCAATGVLAFVTIVQAAVNRFSDALPLFLRPAGGLTYALIQLGVLLLGLLVCRSTLFAGLGELFSKRRGNADSAVAVAAVFCLVQSLTLCFAPQALASGVACLYTAPVLFGLFLNCLGKLFILLRTRGNFRFVSSEKPRLAVVLEEAPDATPGEVVGARAVQTPFLRNFLAISYEPDASECISVKILPAGLLASAAIGVCAYFLFTDFQVALTVFVASLCVSTPVANLLVVNLPLYRACWKLLKKGAMLGGASGAEVFGEVNRLTIADTDLFPKNAVVLRNIKTLSDARVDEAILEAAALLCRVGGPMRSVFEQVVLGQEALPKVEQVQNEPGKGVMGWVGGRRVLLGTGELLRAHGIEPPSRDYEEKNCPQGMRLCYLASGGEIMAMFVLSYTVDQAIREALVQLTKRGVQVCVETADPLLSSEVLAAAFGVDSDRLVAQARDLDRPEPQAEARDALLAVSPRVTSLFSAISVCTRLKGTFLLAVILQTVGVALGFAVLCVLSFSSGAAQIGPFEVFSFELFWALVSLLIPQAWKL